MAQARHIGKIVLGLSGSEAQDEHARTGFGRYGAGHGWSGSAGDRNRAMARGTGRAKTSFLQAEARPARNIPLPPNCERRAWRSPSSAPMSPIRTNWKVFSKKIRATRPPLCAVFHAAGVVQDSVLGKESWNSYRAATAPKIDGAWNLDRLTRNDPVRLMVFFSSAASILGSPGQGSYAAGNAFLDALAHHRASRGLRTLSVNWGAWASAGMAARLAPEQAARWTRQGVGADEASRRAGMLSRRPSHRAVPRSR